jgi:hypothetical protein
MEVGRVPFQFYQNDTALIRQHGKRSDEERIIARVTVPSNPKCIVHYISRVKLSSTVLWRQLTAYCPLAGTDSMREGGIMGN